MGIKKTYKFNYFFQVERQRPRHFFHLIFYFKFSNDFDIMIDYEVPMGSYFRVFQ